MLGCFWSSKSLQTPHRGLLTQQPHRAPEQAAHLNLAEEGEGAGVEGGEGEGAVETAPRQLLQSVRPPSAQQRSAGDAGERRWLLVFSRFCFYWWCCFGVLSGMM